MTSLLLRLLLLLLSFCCCSGGEDAGSAGFLDLLLGRGAEELGLDDHRQLGQMTFAQDFKEAGFADVDDSRLPVNRRSLILGQEGDQLVEIDDGAMQLVPLQMEGPHSHFTEITGMVFVEVDSVMMLSTGVTASTGVLADASVAVAHVTSQLSRLLGLFFRHIFSTTFFNRLLKVLSYFKQIETTQL